MKSEVFRKTVRKFGPWEILHHGGICRPIDRLLHIGRTKLVSQKECSDWRAFSAAIQTRFSDADFL